MTDDFDYTIAATRFDEDYRPADNTRITTNFANLARGADRQGNLRKALQMIENRFNDLARWDNPGRDRYAVELTIISVGLQADADDRAGNLPLIEILKTEILDKKHEKRIEGIVGNNFSSYIRDYDFSIVLPEHRAARNDDDLPSDFGGLHGRLFKKFLQSPAYRENFAKPPVICLSVSSSRTYHRTDNYHPVLGVEYRQDDPSLTDYYFARMGLDVRYFMPPGSVAPLAFYCAGDLLGGYSNLELISTIATMETFQKIYRPEIYNANSAAGTAYRPRLDNADHSRTQVTYDRDERSRLAIEQGQYARDQFIRPYGAQLDRWTANALVTAG